MLNKKYKPKEINEILKSIIILIDTKEKVFAHIEKYFKTKDIKYIRHNLNFGDYSFYIPKNEDLGICEDIYFDKKIAIERKANAEEISNNFTKGRERFKREFERGNGALRLLIEDTDYTKICDHMYDTDLSEVSFIASLHSFQEKYECPFFFVDKTHSGKYIYETFYYYLRNLLK